MISWKIPSERQIERNILPYQETQSFRDVIREFREKFVKASEWPLMSLSRQADKCKDVKQLFPPEDRETLTMTLKSAEAVSGCKVNETLISRHDDPRAILTEISKVKARRVSYNY